MGTESKKTQEETKDFTSEYNEIMESSNNSVVIENQWREKGDFFQKLSMYDNSYVQVRTLGNTTLIKDL